MNAALGVTGLGVMGHSVALTLRDNGFAIVVRDRSAEARARFAALGETRAVQATRLAEWVHAFPRFRRFLIIVRAGGPELAPQRTNGFE